jgi:hypothetical protein
VAVSPQGTAAPGGDSAIDSSGNIVPSEPGSSDPGAAAGSQPNPEGSDVAMNWIDYVDANFGFSLTYPDIYTPLKEPQNLGEIVPNLVGRFRLLEPVIASSAFADREPPKFSIEIYSNAAALSLESWINANTDGGDVESVQVDGVACSQLTLRILLAPNQFIFCAKGDKIFKFTPLGPQSQEILASFKFSRQ